MVLSCSTADKFYNSYYLLYTCWMMVCTIYKGDYNSRSSANICTKLEMADQFRKRLAIYVTDRELKIRYEVGLCDNGKTYISIMSIMHYKIISITIVIAIKL